MALIACPECGKQISDKAESCPGCGYKFKPLEAMTIRPKEGKQPSETDKQKARVGCLVTIIFLAIFMVWLGYTGSKEKEAQEKPKTAEEQRMERIKNGFSSWDGSHKQLTEMIKKSMYDPKSFEFDSVQVNQDGGDFLVITQKYRGKNAFGGVMPTWVKAKVDLDGNVVTIVAEGP